MLRIDDDMRYYKQYDRKVNRHDDFALSAELFGSLAFCLYAGLGFAQSHRLENFDFRSCGVAVFDSGATDVISVKTLPKIFAGGILSGSLHILARYGTLVYDFRRSVTVVRRLLTAKTRVKTGHRPVGAVRVIPVVDIFSYSFTVYGCS